MKFKSMNPNPSYPQVRDVSPEEVSEMKESLHLVDVRRPEEYSGELGHVPGVNLVTLDVLQARLSEVPKDKTVVFICRSGNRSAHAVAIAQQCGYNNVYNMQGGMLRWRELGLEVENGKS